MEDVAGWVLCACHRLGCIPHTFLHTRPLPHPTLFQVKAEADREAAVQYFREWAMSKVPDAEYMNVASGAQIRQLFFPGHAGTITK